MAANKPFSRRYRFWLLLAAALIIHQIPYLSIPFKWLESYFHEISHGLAALVSGGQIVQIQLMPNGAGLCTTRGGSHLLISFMGYAGATLWGTLLYLVGHGQQKLTRYGVILITFSLALTLVFWVKDILTLVIISTLLLIFLFKIKFSKIKTLPVLFQLTGMLVLLNSLYSPLYLIDGRALGDGASLAALTLVPELIWVLAWSILTLTSLYYLGKKL